MNSEIPENESEFPDDSGPDLTEAEQQEKKLPEPEAPEPAPAVKESKEGRSGSAVSFLAFLFAIVALAGTAWMWWQDTSSTGQEEQRVFAEIARLEGSDSELALKLSQIRSEMDSLAAGDVGAEFKAVQRRLEADRAKMDSVEKDIREQMMLSSSLKAAAESIQGRLSATEAALTGLSTRELDASNDLDIAEVDYLLRLANERLKLFSDPVAADQALEVADMHLAALASPMYLGVRQGIAAARRELAAVRMPDYLEIAGQLDSIQQNIASLAFSVDGPVTEAAAPAQEDGWWEKVKGVFSGLVTVRRSTEGENKRISLQDKDYIRQRVWLQLEIAHLSLMQRDQQAFRSSLKRVEDSLSAWFDSSDDAYQNVQQGVDALMAIEVQVDVPDITAPWSMLQLLRASQSRPVPVAPPQEQVPASAIEIEPSAEPETVSESGAEG